MYLAKSIWPNLFGQIYLAKFIWPNVLGQIYLVAKRLLKKIPGTDGASRWAPFADVLKWELCSNFTYHKFSRELIFEKFREDSHEWQQCGAVMLAIPSKFSQVSAIVILRIVDWEIENLHQYCDDWQQNGAISLEFL